MSGRVVLAGCLVVALAGTARADSLQELANRELSRLTAVKAPEPPPPALERTPEPSTRARALATVRRVARWMRERL